MARLTWQNVAAPSVSDSIYGINTAGNLFSGGFSGMADIAGGIDAEKKAKALEEKTRLEDQLLQSVLSQADISSGAGVSEALSGAPVGRLDDVFAGLSNRSTLTNQRQDRASQEITMAGNRLNNEQAEYQFDRTKASDASTDATAALNQWGLEQANLLTQGTTSIEEAKRLTAQNANLSADQKAAIRSGLESFDAESRYGVRPGIGQGLTDTGDFAIVDKGLTEVDDAWTFAANADPITKLYTLGLEGGVDGSSAGTNPADAVMKYGLSKMGDSDRVLFEESEGEIQRGLNELQAEFPDIPPQMIAGAMMGNLESADFRWRGTEDVRTNVDKVREILTQMDTPQERARISNKISEMEAAAEQRANLAAMQEEAKILVEYGTQIGNPQMVARGNQIIADLKLKVGNLQSPAARAPTISVGTGTPAGPYSGGSQSTRSNRNNP